MAKAAYTIEELTSEADIDAWMDILLPPPDPSNPTGPRPWAGIDDATDYFRGTLVQRVSKPSFNNGLESKVFLARAEDGRAVSFGQFWMVPADSVHAYGPGSWPDRHGSIPEVAGSAAARANRGNFFDLMAHNHVLIMGDEPHVFLEMMHTHPDHRGKGYAEAIVRHGNAVLADGLGLASYLDAAPLAISLYRRCGYELQNTEMQWRREKARKEADEREKAVQDRLEGGNKKLNGEVNGKAAENQVTVKRERPFASPMWRPAMVPTVTEAAVASA